MDTVLIWLSHRKCIVIILIGHSIVIILIGRKYYIRHLNKKIFSGSSSTTNEPNFKIVCNCIIHELLNVFEDPAQRVHAIAKYLQVHDWDPIFDMFVTTPIN